MKNHYNLYSPTSYEYSSESKQNLKKFLRIFFRLNLLVNKMYLIGFPSEFSNEFSKFFKKFNVLFLKDISNISGFFTNTKILRKSLKLKSIKDKSHVTKELYSIFKNLNTLDLIIVYEKNFKTQNLIQDCIKLKIPVVVLFGTENFSFLKPSLTIFKNVNFDKNILLSLFFRLAKLVLIKSGYVVSQKLKKEKKKLKERRRRNNRYYKRRGRY